MTLVLPAVVLFGFMAFVAEAEAASKKTVAAYRKTIEPILIKHCYDCHGDGMDKGQVAFDAHGSAEKLVGDNKLWLAVLKNVRAGLMPPEDKPKLAASDIAAIEEWIKRDAFGLDPQSPPAGRVTLHRLNRREYRNTIRDLIGVDFRTDEEFPPDDTGYGFDNIGDVLSLSPLLLEKYLKAAEAIVDEAVPKVAWESPVKQFSGREFKGAATTGRRMSFYEEGLVERKVEIGKAGTYRLEATLVVRGAFDFDPGRARVALTVDGTERKHGEFQWENGRQIVWTVDESWQPGAKTLAFALKPLVAKEKKESSVDLEVESVRVVGPLEPEFRQRPKNYDRFFTETPGDNPKERRVAARKILDRFASKAFRRPVEADYLDELMEFVEAEYSHPGNTFEAGVARGMVAILASPRFLFRLEEIERTKGSKLDPLVDEYSLASRLSYFLWATMPDEELLRLASKKELRKNLEAQVSRMLADNRSREMVDNFVGQWLQVRDIEGVPINSFAVLRRDRGRGEGGRRGRGMGPELDREVRLAMREESELAFNHVARNDRSVLELLDADYIFANETLGKFYGLTNVTGDKMQLTQLPPGSPRGGILTQGAVLAVTSNPDRTSPVKRGLFILDNVLGAPPPPPPANVPSLESAEATLAKDHEPTLREALELHRASPLCRSCHARMDPLGFAFENFNAMGLWRDTERQQPIVAGGKLSTGEEFSTVSELKKILVEKKRHDFYQCLTEKFLTFALGRGLQHYDVETVDQISSRLEATGGKFSALLTGVIESAPFQRRQATDKGARAEAPRPRDVASNEAQPRSLHE